MSQDTNATRNVVIHASESPDDVQRAIGAAQAIGEQFPDASIRIIVNGQALTALPTLDPEHVPNQVQLEACGIGLARHSIAEHALPDDIEVIAHAGVAIVDAQFRGAAYLRL